MVLNKIKTLFTLKNKQSRAVQSLLDKYGSRNLEIILLCCIEGASLHDIMEEEYCCNTRNQVKDMIQNVLLHLINVNYIGLTVKKSYSNTVQYLNMAESQEIIWNDDNFNINTTLYYDVELHANRSGYIEYNNIIQNNKSKRIQSYLDEQLNKNTF